METRHRPHWRVLERGYHRDANGIRRATDRSTLVCLQCVSVWRATPAVAATVCDFAAPTPEGLMERLLGVGKDQDQDQDSHAAG